MNQKREIKWWEISTGDGNEKWTREEAMRAEMKEILDQCQWERKTFFNGTSRDPWISCSGSKDIKDFWEKYRE